MVKGCSLHHFLFPVIRIHGELHSCIARLRFARTMKSNINLLHLGDVSMNLFVAFMLTIYR